MIAAYQCITHCRGWIELLLNESLMIATHQSITHTGRDWVELLLKESLMIAAH